MACLKRPIEMSHEFLSEILNKESILIDATVGNGNDTLFFAPKVAKVYAFDIQEEAIESSRQKLELAEITNVDLILDGHEHLDAYVDQIDLAIFNLGYLPRADKTIITKPRTTLMALEKAITRLKIGGRIAIMVYYGHEGGDREKDALFDYLEKLNQNMLTVMTYQAINQINTPPFLLMIEKIG